MYEIVVIFKFPRQLYWQNIHLTLVNSISIISHLVALLNIASGNFVIIITKTHMVICTCIQGQIA